MERIIQIIFENIIDLLLISVRTAELVGMENTIGRISCCMTDIIIAISKVTPASADWKLY